MRIIGAIHPFDIKQSFYVFDGEKQVACEHPGINEINEIIFGFIQDYNIDQIDLAGPKQYTEGIKQKIEKEEITKFNKNILKINLI